MKDLIGMNRDTAVITTTMRTASSNSGSSGNSSSSRHSRGSPPAIFAEWYKLLKKNEIMKKTHRAATTYSHLPLMNPGRRKCNEARIMKQHVKKMPSTLAQ
jgi:hypothetical protein